MAGRQAPGELEQKLASDLQKIRRDGLHRYSTRLHRLEALQWIAQTVGQGANDYAKLLNVLDRAAQQLGDVYGPTTRALYGIDRAARHLDSAQRTKLAWEVFCAKEHACAVEGKIARKIKRTSFDTHEVEQIKKDIHGALLQLIGVQPGAELAG